MPSARRPWRRLRFATWVLVATPLLLELAVRLWWSLHMGTVAYLLFPAAGALAAAEIATAGEQVERSETEWRFTDVWMDSDGRNPTPLNRDGFRGAAPSSAKQAPWRLAFIGGSSTFSPECAEGRTWPDQVGGLAAKALGQPVEVVNMGRVGWSTAELAPLWAEWAPRADADLLVVSAAYNNIRALGLVDLRPGVAPWHHRLLWGRSLAWTVGWNSWQVRRQRRHHPLALVSARYAGDLEAMVRAARQAGTPVLFVLQPMTSPAHMPAEVDQLGDRGLARLRELAAADAEPHAALLDVMKEVGHRLDVPVVDARAAVQQADVAADSFEIYLHLSEAGAERFASGIDQEVGALGGWRALLGAP